MTELDADDKRYLAQAFDIKRKRPAPRQSNFKVVCIITYLRHKDSESDWNGNTSSNSNNSSENAISSSSNNNGSSGYSRNGSLDSKEEVACVIGGNTETSFIGGTICAERSALVQLTLTFSLIRLLKVYLVSDSPTPLQPGLLCREFLAEFLLPQQDLTIIMASKKDNNNENMTVSISTLCTLYPFMHLYLNIPRVDLISTAQAFSSSCEALTTTRFTTDTVHLYEEVIKATAKDTQDFLHPLKYAAGVLFESGELIIHNQNKLMEYGHTLDPISFLVHQLLHSKRGSEARLLLQCDQFGVLHAPCAPARCQLLEHRTNFPNLQILIHAQSGR